MQGCYHQLLSDSHKVCNSTFHLDFKSQGEDQRRNQLLHKQFVRLPLQAGGRGVMLFVERLDVGGDHDVVDDQVAGFRLTEDEEQS